MDNKEKNIVDKFLDSYENISSNEVRYKKIYQKPSRVKAWVGFIFCIFLLIILLLMFVFNVLYFVIFIGVAITALYYGVNLFTEKGFGLPKRVPIYDDEDKDELE